MLVWVVGMGGEGEVGGGGWAVGGSRGYRGGGGVCRADGSVEGVQVVQGAWRRGSQRKRLSRISCGMVLQGWSTSLRLLVLADTRQPSRRWYPARWWLVCEVG